MELGVAELPLHDGRVPPYLMRRMKRLGSAIARIIIEEFGPKELVRRLADPLWMQAFSNVIGMDWDSSGATTVVIYVLKSFAPPHRLGEEGFAILGGKGSDALNVPQEAVVATRSCRDCVDAERLGVLSKLSAKIDSALLQDGYDLYIHSIALTTDGHWCVVQQGMNVEIRMARRYHLHGFRTLPTVERDPHSAIACNAKDKALNLVDESSNLVKRAILDLVRDTPPSKLVEYVATINRLKDGVRSLAKWLGGGRQRGPEIDSEVLRFYRPVRDYGRLRRIFEVIRSEAPKSFEELVLLKGVGRDTLAALALVAHLIYGYKPSTRDPVTHLLDPLLYAYAHGGKDGYPYPVDVARLEETSRILEEALDRAKLDANEKKGCSEEAC